MAMKVPQGEFDLARYPAPANKTLRAWDAADEFLLRHLADTSQVPDIKGEILIVNDNAGALSTALARHRPKMLFLRDCIRDTLTVGDGLSIEPK